jgi:hypothetical protein
LTVDDDVDGFVVEKGAVTSKVIVGGSDKQGL